MRIYEPSLITFDPLREVHSADENSSKEMRPILKFLKTLRDEYGVTIQLVHHNNKNPLYDNPADSIRGTTSIWGAMDGALFVGTTEQEGVMQVLPRLKEGGQVKPFLYSIKSVGDAIHLTAFEKPEKGGFDVSRIVTWARERGGWWRIEDAVEEFRVSDRTIRPQIKGLEITIRLKGEQASGKQHRLFYAYPGVDDDEPTFSSRRDHRVAEFPGPGAGAAVHRRVRPSIPSSSASGPLLMTVLLKRRRESARERPSSRFARNTASPAGDNAAPLRRNTRLMEEEKPDHVTRIPGRVELGNEARAQRGSSAIYPVRYPTTSPPVSSAYRRSLGRFRARTSEPLSEYLRYSLARDSSLARKGGLYVRPPSFRAKRKGFRTPWRK